MARQLRIEYPGAFYHVTSRGNEKRSIYLRDADRQRFLARLAEAHEKRGAIIHAYCLMENHYHLIIETPRGNLSEILHFINTAHSVYFNARHGRCGHLFQGRFKAVLVDADTYMRELARYIHLNPVRAGLTDLPDQYAWSSYREYVGARPAPPWLCRDFILGIFGRTSDAAQRRFAEFVLEGSGKTLRNPMDLADPRSVLGGAAFVERIRRACLQSGSPDGEIPELRRFRRRPAFVRIRMAAEKVMGPNNRYSRNLAVYLCRTCTDFSRREIGGHFGLGASGVSLVCRKMKKDLGWNAVLGRAVGELESELKGGVRPGAVRKSFSRGRAACSRKNERPLKVE